MALARALFRKGADFTAAMAFEVASTNLVIELGVILALLMGWQFTLAEFASGPVMIVILAVLFRIFLFPGKRYLVWELPDPAGLSVERVRPIRDDIAARVRALLKELEIG